MAELTTASAPTSSCCSTELQATCCEPSDKAACCDTAAAGDSCGCAAGEHLQAPESPAAPMPA
jgi:arsenite methyltransferase